MLTRLIRVDLTRGEVSEEETGGAFRDLGGRGLTSALVADEVDPRCDPLGRENKVVIAPGLFGGSVVPNSGRLSVGAKSPLTGGIKESNVGGRTGQILAGHGIKALVVEGGPAESPKYLHVGDEGVTLRELGEDPFAGNYALHAALRARHGDDCGVLSAGPAGMRRMLCSGLAGSDLEGRPTRYAGRGGLGAVFGSKGLRAIVVEPSKGRRPKPDRELSAAVRELAGKIRENPSAGFLHAMGTAGVVDLACQLGSFPTRSFREGRFEAFGNINGARLVELQQRRGGKTGHRCMSGCLVACSNVFLDDRGSHVTSALEYETLCLLGSNIGVDDIDTIAAFDRACDDAGIDTIELGGAIGVAMDQGKVAYGDSARVFELVREVAEGTETGRLYGNGVVHLARALGAARVPATLGQGHPGHDPRTLNGVGVTYATSPMGADHTAGLVFSPDKANAVEESREHQIYAMLCDTLGLCIFVSQTVPDLAPVYSAFCGREVTPDEMRAWGLRLLRNEAAYNEKAGIAPIGDRARGLFREEALPESGNLFDTDIEAMERIFA